jgi:hypothetical protein
LQWIQKGIKYQWMHSIQVFNQWMDFAKDLTMLQWTPQEL